MSNYLFLIGINIYDNYSQLESSIKDCNDFRDLLLEKFDFDSSNVYELYDKEATNKKIQDAFRGYIKKLTKDDNLIIYYSGHGEYDEITSTGYWISSESNDYTNYINNQTIVNYIDSLKCKHVFLISDCCFSNSLLFTGTFKKLDEYFEKQSRWALTSAFSEAKDSDNISNTLFCEKILEFLEFANKDFSISELSNFVKDEFAINEFQSPQSSPLKISSHKGGEFIFKIKSPNDDRRFRGYPSLNKILKFYKRNAVFKEIESFEDKSLKIGYLLFIELDPVIKKNTYYLYLYDSVNQTKTLKKLKEEHSQIFKDKNLIIFITSEKGQKNKEIRKKNISDKFKPLNLFYIEDFIKEHCTPSFDNESDNKYLNISNFVQPPFKSEINEFNLKDIFNKWFDSIDNPIFVIKGTGGIGKTTVAQYLTDNLLNNSTNLYVLFIDSVQVKDNLLKSKKVGNINIYNFYEALYDTLDSSEEKLSEELFKINLDAGNILIVIDGLDEVISKISNFNVEEFIESINSFGNELGHAKVIITCRTYFWNITEFKINNFKVIELEPFNEVRATEFFNISFSNDTKKIEKAIKLANEFKYPSSNEEKEYIYHPYVLDIVQTILISEQENLKIVESELTSSYLNSKVKSDYIIHRVCQREKIRVGQIDVDKQVEFFIYFSVSYRGISRITDLKSIIEKSINEKIDYNNVEAFKSHPFLKVKDQSISFRYDFLTDLFKSIYIARFLTLEEKDFDVNKDSKFIETVIESCWYGSAFNNDILNRIIKWEEDEFLQVYSIKNDVQNTVSIDDASRKKFVSNIFNLCLTINHSFKNNNVKENSILLNSLFECTNNTIESLSIIDLNSDKAIRFDLSNKLVYTSLFDNYSDFSKCTFNEKTQFVNCTFLNVSIDKSSTLISKNQFVDCTFDTSFEFSMELKESKIENHNESLKLFLNQFFKLFFSNGRLGRQWEYKVISPRFNGINKIKIDYNDFIKILKKQDILEVVTELGKNKFYISETAKESIIKYTKDGSIDEIILNLFNTLKK